MIFTHLIHIWCPSYPGRCSSQKHFVFSSLSFPKSPTLQPWDALPHPSLPRHPHLLSYPFHLPLMVKLGSSQHESIIFSSSFCLCESLNWFRAIKFQKLNQSRKSYMWWIGEGERCEYSHNVSYSYIRYLPAPWRSVWFTMMTHPRTS